MEKHFLDEIYTKALESVIAEKKLNENQIEEFLTEQLTEEKIQNYYKEVIDKFSKNTYKYFLEIYPEEYHKSQVEAQNYQKHLDGIWKKGFELSNAMYLFVLEELESYSNRLEAEHSDELKDSKYKCKVLQLLANRNLQTFSAILTLLQNGFADQAYMLFRNMFENRVVSQFILHNNEESAEQFYLGQVDDIRERNQKTYEWARISGVFSEKEHITFKRLYDKCMFDKAYGDTWYRQYQLACKLLHTTPQGIAKTLASTRNGIEISLVGQTPYGLNLAAEHSAIMLEETVKNYLCLFHDQSNLMFVIVMHKWVGLIQEVYSEIGDSFIKDALNNKDRVYEINIIHN